VQLARPRKIHVFHLATRPSSLPGPPFSVILVRRPRWVDEKLN